MIQKKSWQAPVRGKQPTNRSIKAIMELTCSVGHNWVLLLAALLASTAAAVSDGPQLRRDAAFVSSLQSLPLRRPAGIGSSHHRGPGTAPAFPSRGAIGAANLAMKVKLQKEKQMEYGFQRWWDADWRGMQTDNIKDPEAQVQESLCACVCACICV